MVYVDKKIVKKHNKLFYDAISEVRPKIKEKGITFQYRLVGSAKRHMVVSDDNQGFDCDYQIILMTNKNNFSCEEIKDLFIDKFDESFVDRGFKHSEDSSRAITIKKINIKQSKVLKAYDVVILKWKKDGFYILNNDKAKEKGEKGKYTLEKLPRTEKYAENAKMIRGSEMWEYLRKIYLKKKEEETEERKSFQIFNNSVNETLDKFKKQ